MTGFLLNVKRKKNCFGVELFTKDVLKIIGRNFFTDKLFGNRTAVPVNVPAFGRNEGTFHQMNGQQYSAPVVCGKDGSIAVVFRCLKCEDSGIQKFSFLSAGGICKVPYTPAAIF